MMARTIRLTILTLALGALAQPVAAQTSGDTAPPRASAAAAAAESAAVAAGSTAVVAESAAVESTAAYPPITFEPPKDDGASFAGLEWSLGAAFATEFQALSHANDAQPVLDADGNDMNALASIGGGFNLGTANLDLSAALAPGMKVAVRTYLSSRHHPDAWVKDGYLRVDRSPIDVPALNRAMDYLTLKVGHFEVNYGDAHFRRTDNGDAMRNPFVENLILDGFATEIGSEVYARTGPFLAMVGVTNGLIDGDVTTPEERDYAFLAKLGVDYRLGDVLQARLTGSTYQNDNAGRATLYAGDRAGSRYFYVMDNADGSSFRNGRVNPDFTKVISTYQVNPFLKLGGIELFGVLEWAEGRTARETEERAVSQYAFDALYRLLDGQAYVAGRYNTFSGELYQVGSEQSVARTVLSAGWFLNQYVLLKAEYVRQTYDGFPSTDIRSGGEFDGLVVQAAVAF